LLLIGTAIKIISTTTGSVFSASLGSATNSNSVISAVIDGIIGIAMDVLVIYYLFI
jgi:hypothetical protein